jgi:hypothetical protein
MAKTAVEEILARCPPNWVEAKAILEIKSRNFGSVYTAIPRENGLIKKLSNTYI